MDICLRDNPTFWRIWKWTAQRRKFLHRRSSWPCLVVSMQQVVPEALARVLVAPGLVLVGVPA
jgi:hypothetical protein